MVAILYVLGHVALAYIPVAAYSAIARKRLAPDAFLALLYFANMQDSIHVGILRELSHNFLGTIVMFAGIFMLLRWAKLVENGDWPLMAFAAAMHVVGDMLFSGFNPVYPFVDAPATVWYFNSIQDIVAEGILGAIFVATAWVTGDWARLRPHISERVKLFYRQKWLPIRDKYYYPLHLFAVMLSMSIIQIAIGIHYNGERAIEGVWYAIMFLGVFMAYLLALSSAVWPRRT
jgi:hypothetical protein